MKGVQLGALNENSLREQGILTGSYSGVVRDDGSVFFASDPQVNRGGEMVLSGSADSDGTIYRLDAGAAAAGQTLTVDWAAREGSAGVFAASIDGGQRYLINGAGRIDGLGVSVSFGADGYDYAAGSARYEARVAAAENYNQAMRIASSYAIYNPDAAAHWRYRAREGAAAADAARWSGFRKQAYNDGASFLETAYRGATLATGPAGQFAPQLHVPRASILPQERTGATTFTAASTAASVVVPLAAPELAAVRAGSLSNYSRAPLVLDGIGAAEGAGAKSASLWARAEVNGTRVYQRSDLIDPGAIDSLGRTNLQRMERGLAPVGPDGKPINLHHMLQTNDGPIAEMTQTFHQQNSRVIHINPSTTPSGIDRRAFDAWRSDYWKTRAGDFR